MNRVVFLEDRLQVGWVIRNIRVDEHTKLLAITAEAVQALEEFDLSFTPISDVADMHLLASAERQYTVDCLNLLNEIESFLLEKYPPAKQVGQGFLTGQAYYMQMSIGGIATRAFLMREALRAFSPAFVTVFHVEIDNWFGDDGYERNPWIETFLTMSVEHNFQVEIIPLQKPKTKSDILRVKNVYVRLRSRTIEWAKDVFALLSRMREKNRKNTNAFRLLFADARLYDWGPVLRVLRNDRRFSLSFLKSVSLAGRGLWAHYYQDVVYGEFLLKGLSLKCAPIHFDKNHQDVLSELLDDWIAAHPGRARINVLGMELFPALLPHLRSMLLLSVPLMRYANEVAIKVLDATRPHAVCFFAMPGLSAKVLAFQAQQRGIPVVSYQHGGSYGVQEVPYHDFAEFAYSDYFLTYGDGILPPENPVLPTRAQFISVGSTRIKSTLVKESVISKKREVFNVLWIAEVSRKNTLSASLIVEDTTRYTLQRKSLEMLSRARNVNVIYRPFPGQLQAQATPRWIKQSGLSCIQLDSFTSITDSILASDLIICDSSSNTTWNDVLALGKPLIVYCDPKQIILMDHFAKDLEQACYWCKSVSELLDVMNRLAKEPEAFLEEVRQRPVNEYLGKYVLHERDSVERVISFLSVICAQTQNLPNMDTSNASNTTLVERQNGEN